MQPSTHAEAELEKARKAIARMRDSTTLEELEEHWKAFLVSLERVWNKIFAHYQRSPKWHSWHGKFLKLRRNDPLLRYLKNARDADEHTVQNIVDRNPGTVSISALDGRGIQFEAGGTIEFGQDGVTNFDLRTETPVEVKFTPGKIMLVPVRNYDDVYEVPTTHLGHAVDPSDIPSLAERGVEFYADALLSAHAFFVEKNKRRGRD